MSEKPTVRPGYTIRRRWLQRLAVVFGTLVSLAVLVPHIGPAVGAHFGDTYARNYLAPALATPFSDDQVAAVRRSSWFPSDEVVEQLHGALESPTVGPWVRLDVVAALGRIGTPRALAVLETGWVDDPSVTSWWRPPAPSEPLRTAAVQASVPLTGDAATMGCRVEVPEASGTLEPGTWLLFREPNGTMLWWVRIPDAGHPWPSSRYVARSLEEFTPHAWACELEGLRLSVYEAERTAEAGSATQAGSAAERTFDRRLLGELDLARVDTDTDGDGLTDIYESFLTTDPRRVDTDGDGLKDSVDLAPTSGGQVDAIWATSLRDLVEGLSGPPGDSHFVEFLQAPLGVEWRRASGPTIRLPPGTLGPDGMSYQYSPLHGRPLADLVLSPTDLMAEIEWRLSGSPPRFELPGGCMGFLEVRMRRIGDRWYIADAQNRRYRPPLAWSSWP